MFRFLIFFCLIVCTKAIHSQTDAFTFTNYTTANGLADNSVNSILQDSRGFMWFGTREGLSRFDGTNFKNFFGQKNDGTLPGNLIWQLHEYKPGHLLMLSSGTLTCLNTITQEFYQPPAFRGKSVYWVNFLENNQYCVNRPDTSFITDHNFRIIDTLVPPFIFKETVAQVFVIDSNTWLVGTLFEYYFYRLKEKKYEPFLLQKDMPSRDPMLRMHYYDSSNKWLYFSNYYGGLYRYSLDGKIIYNWKTGTGPSELLNSNIGFVVPKNDSILWVGIAENKGLNILNTRTNIFTRVEASDNNNSSLVGNSLLYNYTDHDKNEWLASTVGISKLNNSTANIKSWKAAFTGMNNNSTLLNILKGDNGQMYVSSFATGYGYRISVADGMVYQLDKTKLPGTWCMNTFGQEIVFTGGGTRVTWFNPLTNQYRQSDLLKKYFPVSDIVILAFKHSNGDEWYSGNNGGGFVRVDAKDGSIHQYKKEGPRGSFTISYYPYYVEDKKGDLWFGVNKSSRLLHWDKATDYFNEIDFDTIQGITENHHSGITDITLDSEHNIWVAFDGTGVIKYNPSAKTGTHYTLQDGLPTGYAYALKFDDKNRLWIGTLKGLSCLLVNENRFINFTTEDGLPADFFDERCIYFDSSSHHLWIGSQNTLMQFDPDVLLGSTRKKIPVYIDEITVNGRNYKNDFSNILFSPSQNSLQFRFIGVDINNGKDIEYSYQLTGADKDWIYNGNISTAAYANLAPGNYSFIVRARHKGDNEWSVMQAPLTFTIETPWHKTTWFRILMGIALSLLVWFIIRAYYLRKLEKEKAVLEKKQAIEKERTRIATDMHDDFGASLSRIKFLSEKLQLQKNGEINPNQDLGKISAYSDEMAEKMGEIVWALNQRYDSSGDLVSFCRSYASEYLEDKPIKLDFSTGVLNDIQINGEIRRNIFLVMKESLHNIVKHAQASEVIISMRCDKELQMTIHDNGSGFDITIIRPFANGLENMKKRMEEIGGRLSIETGKGTKISIVIPHPHPTKYL